MALEIVTINKKVNWPISHMVVLHWPISNIVEFMVNTLSKCTLSFVSSVIFTKRVVEASVMKPKLHRYGYGIVPDMGMGTRIHHFFKDICGT